MSNAEDVLKKTLTALKGVVADLEQAGIEIDIANAPSSGDHSGGAPKPPLDPKTSTVPLTGTQEADAISGDPGKTDAQIKAEQKASAKAEKDAAKAKDEGKG